ncbi:MAG: sulfite exporter TauE/SafE family protein [Bryobacteraceae bacterium]|jgi:ABC-type nickel/cobalt efflux system permease component RcnA
MRYSSRSKHPLPGITVLFALILSCAATSFAHPMGNFSINHYAKITVGQRSIEIRYLIDMAEIPTFQEIRQFDITPTADDPSVARYLDRQRPLLEEGILLQSDGQPVRLDSTSRQVAFTGGAGGLPTMKIGFVFRGRLDAAAGPHKLTYVDNNFPGRAGWKEIVVLGDGVTMLENSAPGADRSHELTIYSSDALNSPPQQLSAFVRYNFQPSIAQITRAPHTAKPKTIRQSPAPVASTVTPRPPAPQAGNTPRSRFTELISTQGSLSFWVLFSAALIAAGLGALHALEPGHGKTLVAAYLVGSRGTARHAVLLGIVVTAAHTAGVYLLGAATLYASRYIVPEQLYPWLGAISGLSVAGLGIFIFLRHWTGETGEHSHAAGERHSHWFLSMLRPAAVSADSKSIERPLSLRELCMLGITGGIVPCPAALVVLLSAFSLHRIVFGLFLITAFSFGLAAVLVIVGLTMVYAKRAMSTRVRAGNVVLRYLPLLSSACMVVLGVGITASAIASVHLRQLSTGKLVPFVTVLLVGLFLGMRHSTDPDHVVAVSTIVSRQGSIRSSATIGLLWGLGHTLTIFLVGSAIIIFGVVIPPRLGLSMEFCVALMLVLLGVLNLTGVMRWITERFTPVQRSEVKPRASVGKLGLFQTIRPFAVGLVHGLAGSAAVALLVLSTIKSPLWSTAYLLVFGFGTMLGMMLMTAAISMPFVYTGKAFFQINRYMIALSGFASLAFGIFLVYHIGFVDGLFTSQMHWTPQ